MPRKKDSRREDAFKLWESGMTIKEIAIELDTSESLLRNWKSTDQWEGDSPKRLQSDRRKNDKRYRDNKPKVTKRINVINDKIGNEPINDSDNSQTVIYSEVKTLQEQIKAYEIREKLIQKQIDELEAMPTGAITPNGEDIAMIPETVRSAKGLDRDAATDLIEVTSVHRDKRMLELYKELSKVQAQKTNAISTMHRIKISNIKYGIDANEAVEVAKANQRAVLEALTGEVPERKMTFD